MMSPDALHALLESWGLAILAPLATLEGPVVSVLAGGLAQRGLLDPAAVLVCVILADLVGDVLLYQLGRHGGPVFRGAWLARLGVGRGQLARLIRAFRRQGVQLIVVGKLTHGLGFAVLLAAGAARMPFAPFLAASAAATVPKSLALVGLGWALGEAWMRPGDWRMRLASGVLALAALALLVGLGRRRAAAR